MAESPPCASAALCSTFFDHFLLSLTITRTSNLKQYLIVYSKYRRLLLSLLNEACVLSVTYTREAMLKAIRC